MPFYAVYFKYDVPPGQHWNVNAKADDPDRRQHWRKGDLWSTGTVVADPLPMHLEKIELSERPVDGQVWDRDKLAFVTDTEAVQRLIDAHQADIDARIVEIARLSALK